jgi:MFS family permease
MTRKSQGDGSDCLYFAAALSVLMVFGCFLLPANPPVGTGKIPVVIAMRMLGDAQFLVFILISLVVFGLMQFYFLGSAQFMQDMGVASQHVPGSMALAQLGQALFTWFLLAVFLGQFGFKWTLTIGAGCWVVLYAVYVVGGARWSIIGVQPFHGFAYVFFVIVGQIFSENVAPKEIRSSMQALYFAATTGVGLFLGTQFAGAVMDCFSAEGKFQWRKVWLVPGAITLAGVIALAALFRDPPKKKDAEGAAERRPAAAAQADPI